MSGANKSKKGEQLFVSYSIITAVVMLTAVVANFLIFNVSPSSSGWGSCLLILVGFMILITSKASEIE